MAICNSAVLACLLAKQLASLTLLLNSSLLSLSLFHSHHRSAFLALPVSLRIFVYPNIIDFSLSASFPSRTPIAQPQTPLVFHFHSWHTVLKGSPTGSALCLDVWISQPDTHTQLYVGVLQIVIDQRLIDRLLVKKIPRWGLQAGW